MGAGLILGLRPANGERCYLETTSLIGWAQINLYLEYLNTPVPGVHIQHMD